MPLVKGTRSKLFTGSSHPRPPFITEVEKLQDALLRSEQVCASNHKLEPDWNADSLIGNSSLRSNVWFQLTIKLELRGNQQFIMNWRA